MNPSFNDTFGSFNNGQNNPVYVENNKKNRAKPFILIAVIFFFVLVGIMIFALIHKVLPVVKEGKKDLVNNYMSLLVSGSGKENGFSANTLSIGMLKNNVESERNIYNALLTSDPLGEENVGYYNDLMSTLEMIGKSDVEDGSDNLSFWANTSMEMMPRYFVSSILVLTNADYEYYMQNRNIDGLLEKYDYPFEETDEVFLQSYDDLINDYYEQKIVLYSEINKTNCVMNDGIDYKCLSSLNNETIKATQFAIEDMYTGMKEISNSMLNIIISNANSMYDYFIGGQND